MERKVKFEFDERSTSVLPECNCHYKDNPRVMAFQHAPTCPVYQMLVQHPDLADQLNAVESAIYERYEPTPDEVARATEAAAKFLFAATRPQQVGKFVEYILENRRLTHEVNTHRKARGYELIPEHKL